MRKNFSMKYKIISVVVLICVLTVSVVAILQNNKGKLVIDDEKSPLGSIEISPTLEGTESISDGNTTYFVSQNDGDDANDGKSNNMAWKTLENVNNTVFAAGDKILFECGGIWNGNIRFKGSGTAENPIIVSCYGNGDKPLIHGDPNAAYEEIYYSERILYSSTIELVEVSNWKIENLEITNKGENSLVARAGIGVWDSAKSAQEYESTPQDNISIMNCYIHDVESDLQLSKRSGGIIFIGNINNVTIDGNFIENTSISGIRNASGSAYVYGQEKAYYLENYSITNNTIKKVIGDGIVLGGVQNSRVAYNTVDEYCLNYLDKDYAGIWTWSCQSVVIEYNEVSNAPPSTNDARAFDVDWYNDNILIQYNYSHGNAKGFAMFSDKASKIVFRHNVSINDGYSEGSVLVSYSPTSKESAPLFYNNLIYQNNQIKSRGLFNNSMPESKNIYFKLYNNIFISSNTAKFNVDNNVYGDISNNIFQPYKVLDDSKLKLYIPDIIQDNYFQPDDHFEDIPLGQEPEGLITQKNHFNLDKLEIFNKAIIYDKVSYPVEKEYESEIWVKSKNDFFGNEIQQGNLGIGASSIETLEPLNSDPKELSETIKKSVLRSTSENDGVYKNWIVAANKMPYGLEYVYRGSDPDNYIILDESCFRIIGLTNNGQAKLVYQGRAVTSKQFDASLTALSSIGRLGTRFPWNSIVSNDVKVDNNWGSSPISLKSELDKVFDAGKINGSVSFEKEKDFIDNEAVWYIGKIKLDNPDMETDQTQMFSEKITGAIGTLNPTDYIQASLDERSDSITAARNPLAYCTNKNYLSLPYYFWTMNGCGSDKSSAWGVTLEGRLGYIGTSNPNYAVRPVVFLKPGIKVTGSGTASDAYKVFVASSTIVSLTLSPGPDGSYIATANIPNSFKEDLSALLIVSVYDKSGSLVDVETKKIKILSGEASVENLSVFYSEKVYTVKAFLWNLADFTPLCAEQSAILP